MESKLRWFTRYDSITAAFNLSSLKSSWDRCQRCQLLNVQLSLYSLIVYGMWAFQKWIPWRHTSVVAWLGFKATGVDVSVSVVRSVCEMPSQEVSSRLWLIYVMCGLKGWLCQLNGSPPLKDKTRWDKHAEETIGPSVGAPILNIEFLR